jgi:hypothetical protein
MVPVFRKGQRAGKRNIFRTMKFQDNDHTIYFHRINMNPDMIEVMIWQISSDFCLVFFQGKNLSSSGRSGIVFCNKTISHIFDDALIPGISVPVIPGTPGQKYYRQNKQPFHFLIFLYHDIPTEQDQASDDQLWTQDFINSAFH